jgi:hypothetical protein
MLDINITTVSATTTNWFITIPTFTAVAIEATVRLERQRGLLGLKLAVQTSTTDGLMIDAVVVLGLHFLHRMKSQADWDTHFAYQP